MRTRQGNRLFVFGCMTVILTGLASTGEAGLIPWVWDALFGPVRQPHYSSYYRSSYYGPSYGYSPYRSGRCSPCGQSGYRPMTNFSPSAYSPCGPSGCSTAACQVTHAALPQRTIEPAKADEENWEPRQPQTFAPVPKKEIIEPKTGDEGFGRSIRGDDANSPKGPTTIDAFKEPVINTPKKPAPTTPVDEGDDATKSESPKSPFENITEPKDKNETRSLPIPKFKLNEEKVTWRVVPQRTRLLIRASYTSPTLARRKVELNGDWVPVVSDTKIAGK